MAKELKKHYSARELSAFCLQISLLLRAAIPLDEGLSVMAEDAADEEEKKILLHMSEEVELGSPFSVVLEQVGSYPSYVIRMAKLGEETGTLDQMMASLSEYYEKEYILMKSIKNAVTYPVIMIFMLLVVLFVLFTKVMPIFESVYEQLGARQPRIHGGDKTGRHIQWSGSYCGDSSGRGGFRYLAHGKRRQKDTGGSAHDGPV